MDLGKLALLLGPGAVEPTGSGPSGPPGSINLELYLLNEPGNGSYRVLWTAGDASAYTRVYRSPLNNTADNFAGATLLATLNPGTTSHNTGLQNCSVETGCTPLDKEDYRFYVTHLLNGSETADISFNSEDL